MKFNYWVESLYYGHNHPVIGENSLCSLNVAIIYVKHKRKEKKAKIFSIKLGTQN